MSEPSTDESLRKRVGLHTHEDKEEAFVIL